MSLTAQIALFLAAAVVAVPLFRRLRLGAVLGYLAAGIVVGPSGLGLVTDVGRMLQLAEFGVVLLLFVIGLELQPTRLVAMRRVVFGVGLFQVLASTALLGLAAWLLGQSLRGALLIGFALSLSSTALVLQVLAEREELKAHHARAAFGTLLFQDIAAMAALALLPFLGPDGGAGPLRLESLLPAVGAVGLAVLAGRYALGPLLRVVAATRVRETFTATALLVVVGSALLFGATGLSMAFGAFVAGVLLADSEYRHEHPDRERSPVLADFHLAAHAAFRGSVFGACRSATRLANPSVWRRMSAPSRLMSTRSTSSWTIRACSAGNSSSQSGSSRSRVSRTSASMRPSAAALAAFHVRTMISGARSRPRSWSTTAFSISAADMRRMGQASGPRFRTLVVT